MKKKESEISHFFTEYTLSDIRYKTLSYTELQSIIFNMKYELNIEDIENSSIIKTLKNSGNIVEQFFSLPNGDKTRFYTINGIDYTMWDIASASSRTSFFSHYSALFLNSLTLQIPKQIYLTNERNKREYHRSDLNQENIDRAMTQTPRTTSNTRKYSGYNINLINGQSHDRIGVIKNILGYETTDIERTLIDCVVRPFYAGGTTQVKEAFENAKDIIDVEKMCQYYRKMDFIYPYSQSIAFYLDICNYSKQDISHFERLISSYKFYLTYNIHSMEYSEKWKLFYPKGLIRHTI